MRLADNVGSRAKSLVSVDDQLKVIERQFDKQEYTRLRDDVELCMQYRLERNRLRPASLDTNETHLLQLAVLATVKI